MSIEEKKADGSVNIDDVNAQNEQDKQELAEQANKKQREENDEQTHDVIDDRHQTQQQQREDINPQKGDHTATSSTPDIPSARNATRTHDDPLTSATPKTVT